MKQRLASGCWRGGAYSAQRKQHLHCCWQRWGFKYACSPGLVSCPEPSANACRGYSVNSYHTGANTCKVHIPAPGHRGCVIDACTLTTSHFFIAFPSLLSLLPWHSFWCPTFSSLRASVKAIDGCLVIIFSFEYDKTEPEHLTENLLVSSHPGSKVNSNRVKLKQSESYIWKNNMPIPAEIKWITLWHRN